MARLCDNLKYWGDNSEYWLQHAERARKRAEQVRESAEYAHDYVSKQRTLKLAKRYDQMANVAEERAKKHGSNRSP
jgi:hypothetical protein